MQIIKPFILLSLSFLLACSSTDKTTNNFSRKHKKSLEISALPEREQIKFKFLFHNANKEYILGNYQLSASLFSQCIQIAPLEPAPYFELATIYDLGKDKLIVLKYAKEAAKLDPNNYWYTIMYAQSLHNAGEPEKAISIYKLLIKNYPQKINLYYDLSNIQLSIGKYEDAIKNYNSLEKITGINEEVSIQKEKIYIKLGDVDKAAMEIQNLINAFPNENMYKGLLADLYTANDMPEKAFAIYQVILKNDSNNAYIHLSLYNYYREKKENDKAFKEVKYAFSNKDLDIDIKMKILLSYYSVTQVNNKLKKEAAELNQILIKTHPKEAKPYTIYADFLYRDKKLESARKNYLKAAEFDNSKYVIWSQLLFIDAELQNNEYMLKDSKAAIDLFPNQALFYFFYGSANLQKKNYKEAQQYLQTGKDFVADNPQLLIQFYANLGDAYNGLKNYKKSDEAYEKTLTLDPKNIYVLNNYSYYLSLRAEKLDRAEELSALCNELEPDQSNYEDTYAWILYKQGKFIQAKEWLLKAIKHGGSTNSVILEHLGDVYAQLKDLDKALDFWLKARKEGEGTALLEKKITDKKLYE